MNRTRIKIAFERDCDVEINPCKYFIQSINKIQSSFEFSFIDKQIVFDSSLTKNEHYFDVIDDWNKKQDQYIVFICSKDLPANYFWFTNSNYAIITTNRWEKRYAPPSVFEFIIHSILGAWVNLEIGYDSKVNSTGCLRDFTKFKSNRKQSVLVGYISEDLSSIIVKNKSDEFLADMQKIIDRNWIGDKLTIRSVAYELMNSYKFDIERDSGFHKGWLKRAFEGFVEIPKEITLVAMGAIITYVIGKLLSI